MMKRIKLFIFFDYFDKEVVHTSNFNILTQTTGSLSLSTHILINLILDKWEE